MRHRSHPVLVLGFALLALPAAAGGEPAPKAPTRERLAGLLEPIRKKYDVPALVRPSSMREGPSRWRRSA